MANQLTFSPTVADKLGCYVYRLIDPRNGQTFYVGKGTGNRVFAHARDELAKIELSEDYDDATAKLQIIRDIHRSGFEVIHVVHRHGMDEKTAREVEAALIDAYPEASNLVGGLDSDKRGLMHARQIIERYEAPEVVFHHSAILINVTRSLSEDKPLYDAVRYAWKLDHRRARGRVVLAVDRGLIIGAFIPQPSDWLAATPDNFPGFPTIPEQKRPRWGFVGHAAPEDIAKLYLRHRLPDDMRKRGAQTPIRYADASGVV